MTNREYQAAPVILPPEARISLGYRETSREPIVVERSRSVGGVEVRATVESYLTAYQRTAESADTAESSRNGPRSTALEAFAGGSEVLVATGDALGLRTGTLPFLEGDTVVAPEDVFAYVPKRLVGDDGSVSSNDMLYVTAAARNDDYFTPTVDGAVFAGEDWIPGSIWAPEAGGDGPVMVFGKITWDASGEEAPGPIGTFEGGETLDKAGPLLDRASPLLLTASGADFSRSAVTLVDVPAGRVGARLETLVGDGTSWPPAGLDGGLVTAPSDSGGPPPQPMAVYADGGTFFPKGFFTPEQPLVAAPVDDVFDVDYADGLARPVTQGLRSESGATALFVPPPSSEDEPSTALPEPYTVIEPGTEVDTQNAIVFFPKGFFSFSVPVGPAVSGAVREPLPDDGGRLFPKGFFDHPGGANFRPGRAKYDYGALRAAPETSVVGPGGRTVGGASGGLWNVGALSTPKASMMGKSLNPLARLSFEEILTDDRMASFLRRAGLSQLSDVDTVEWTRGPEFIADRTGTCVGKTVELRSYAGVLAGDPPTAAYVHLARTEADSVVIAGSAHGVEVTDARGSFVGTDGFVSQDEFDAAVDSFATAAAAFRYG